VSTRGAEHRAGPKMSTPEIVLFDYDPRWPERFEQERERILAALGARALAVEHFGSTAVPGLGAKPIIDILVGVRELSAGEACLQPLRALGYEEIQWRRFTDRYFMQRGGWRARTHHLHIMEHEGTTWVRLLRLRDRLRANPELARQYFEIKRQAAGQPGISRRDYNMAKAQFIEAMLGDGMIQAGSDERR
jgi:GrpB-like predicted nucleotidyltransferase (UPF0157 family)